MNRPKHIRTLSRGRAPLPACVTLRYLVLFAFDLTLALVSLFEPKLPEA